MVKCLFSFFEICEDTSGIFKDNTLGKPQICSVCALSINFTKIFK